MKKLIILAILFASSIASIKSGVFSDVGTEISHILSATSPISWVDPSKNKYTMLGGVDETVRDTLGLASPNKVDISDVHTIAVVIK